MILDARTLFRITTGKYIRQTRKTRGLTQAALARKAGISTTYLSYIENGSKSMSSSIFLTIALALETKPSEIMKEVESELLPILLKNNLKNN